MPAAVNSLKKQKKTQEPIGEPILEPTDEPVPSPILAPPHLAGSTAGVSTLPDLPPGYIWAHVGPGSHRRRRSAAPPQWPGSAAVEDATDRIRRRRALHRRINKCWGRIRRGGGGLRRIRKHRSHSPPRIRRCSPPPSDPHATVPPSRRAALHLLAAPPWANLASLWPLLVLS